MAPLQTTVRPIPPVHGPGLTERGGEILPDVLQAPKEMKMLADSLVVTTLVVTDVDEAKRFYKEQLGLALLEETAAGCRFGAGKGSQLSIRRGQPSSGGQTVAHFEVNDIEAVVSELTARGVRFDEYEAPKTVNFIAQIGPARGAWFKDPAGNVLGLREGPVPGAR